MEKVAVSNAQYPRPQHALCSSVTQLCLPPSVSCLSVCLYISSTLPPAPTPPPPTRTAVAPNFSTLQFPSDSTIFSISTRTSHTRSNSVTSAASSLVNNIGLTSFQAFTTGQIFSLQADARQYSPPRNPTD